MSDTMNGQVCTPEADDFIERHKAIAEAATTVVSVSKARKATGPYKFYYYRGTGDVKNATEDDWVELGVVMDICEPDFIYELDTR